MIFLQPIEDITAWQDFVYKRCLLSKRYHPYKYASTGDPLPDETVLIYQSDMQYAFPTDKIQYGLVRITVCEDEEKRYAMLGI